MTRHINLSADDRRLLAEMLETSDLDQTKAAALAEVTQPWLSQILRGRRHTKVNHEMLERLARVLVDILQHQRANSSFPEDRAQVAFTFLSRFTPAAAALVPRKIHRAGGPMPVDAVPNIKRDEDDEALIALQDLPFTMMVAGPVQCGKSTLLARLAQKARDNGVETAWFDARLPASRNAQAAKHQADSNAAAALALSELLRTQWGLAPPRDGVPDSIPRLIRWLLEALAPTASKPRLLIMDDLAKLGARAADDWLSFFVRKMDTRAITGVQLSIAVGLTHRFAQDFARKLIELSSIVHWSPKIELGWFGSSEIAELESAVTGAKSLTPDLWNLFKGQPYLTHAAALDTEFRESVRRWTEKPTAAKARPIREAVPYTRHLAAIKFAISGSTFDADDGATQLVETFIRACAGKPQFPMVHHQELFLKKAKLLDDGGKPTLPIYKLIAEDLRKLINE